MKKLMIAAAIVCAAAVSQAATTKWGATTGANAIYASGQATKTVSGTAYLFCQYTADSATTATIYSQDDILDAFAAGTSLSTLAYQKELTVGSDGKIAATPFTSEDFAAKKAVKFFFAIVNGDEIYISATQQKTSNQTTQQTMTFNTAASSQAKALDIEDGYSAAGWYAVAVPEPFSGSLALLGLGAVALRRKMKKAKKA